MVQCDRAITGMSKMLISLRLGCVCPSVTLILFLADEFSISAITNYCKFNGLKQDTFITAQLFGSEVRHKSHQDKIKVLTRLYYFFFISFSIRDSWKKISCFTILFIETTHLPCFLSPAAIENVLLIIICSIVALCSRFCNVQNLRITLEQIYFLSHSWQKQEGLLTV